MTIKPRTTKGVICISNALTLLNINMYIIYCHVNQEERAHILLFMKMLMT